MKRSEALEGTYKSLVSCQPAPPPPVTRTSSRPHESSPYYRIPCIPETQRDSPLHTFSPSCIWAIKSLRLGLMRRTDARLMSRIPGAKRRLVSVCQRSFLCPLFTCGIDARLLPAAHAVRYTESAAAHVAHKERVLPPIRLLRRRDST